jgi:hypothetical protein
VYFNGTNTYGSLVGFFVHINSTSKAWKYENSIWFLYTNLNM